GVITVVVVPLALYLLHRALRAARSIERYTREALEAGGGIAANTAAIAALEETVAAARSLLAAAEALKRRSAEGADAVAGAAGREGGEDVTTTEFLVAWTLVLAAAVVLALAVYLTAVAYYLYRAGGHRLSHLARLADGLVAVRGNAAPLERQLAAAAQVLVA